MVVAVGLIGAVLSGVEDLERGEAAVVQGAVEVQVRTSAQGAGAEGHHLVVGLVGVRPSVEELGGVDAVVFGDLGGVVVLDLVVVPRHEPRAAGVHGLEVRVGPVLRVADSVVGERYDLRPACLRTRLSRPPFS